MPLTNFFPGLSIDSPLVPDIGANLPVPSMRSHVLWFDDFIKYTAGDWTLTETDSAATEALTTGHGGQLLITNTGADNDVTSLQLGTTSFAMAAGRKFWMEWRVKASEATDFEIFLGLAVTDTSPIASLPSECAAFYKADDAATWQWLTRSGSATLHAETGIATLTANTFQTLGVYYDGGQILELYVDGAKVGGSTTLAFASLFPTVDMRVTMAVQAGAAAAKTATIDYGLVMAGRA